MSSSNLKEHLYNDLRRKNVENKQFTINKIDQGQSLRRADIEQPKERSVSGPPGSLTDFYSIFQKILTTAESYDKVNYDLKITTENPSDPSVDTELPIISVKLLGRDPEFKEIKPRLVREVNDPDNAGNILEIYIQRQTNRIAFDIWTMTNKQAEILANWVEEIFFEYLWVFEKTGFPHVNYLGRDEDKTETIKNSQLVHKRRLRFEVITSRITKRSEAKMRKISIEFGIDKPDSSDLIDRS